MKDRILLLFLAGGFAFLCIETRYIHQGITAEQPVAWVPIIAGGFGALFCLLGMLGGKKMNQVLGLLMILVAMTGLVGFWFHHGGTFERQANLNEVTHLVSSELQKDRFQRIKDGGSTEDPPPDLAPLGYTGLGMIAAVTLLMNRKEKSVS